MNQTIIRSKRKTLGLEVGLNGLIIRAPLRVTDREIEAFVQKHLGWIEAKWNKIEETKKKQDALPSLSMEEIKALADRAMQVIPERVKFYAPLVGVTYGSITIRNQRSRWGSCSSNGNLNFNCLLMLMPPEVIDSVVVHELCHRKEMNHSDRFYAEVLRVFPEYRTWNKWLKENGAAILRRMVQEKG